MFMNPENLKKINNVGKYDKTGVNRGKSDLKDLKLNSDVSNENFD